MNFLRRIAGWLILLWMGVVSWFLMGLAEQNSEILRRLSE